MFSTPVRDEGNLASLVPNAEVEIPIAILPRESCTAAIRGVFRAHPTGSYKYVSFGPPRPRSTGYREFTRAVSVTGTGNQVCPWHPAEEVRHFSATPQSTYKDPGHLAARLDDHRLGYTTPHTLRPLGVGNGPRPIDRVGHTYGVRDHGTFSAGAAFWGKGSKGRAWTYLEGPTPDMWE